MAEKLMFKYDREADILYIDKQTPYAEQETEELGDDVIAPAVQLSLEPMELGLCEQVPFPGLP